MATSTMQHTEASWEPKQVAPQVMGISTSEGLRMRSRGDPAPEDDKWDENSVTQEAPSQEERQWSLFVVLASGLDVLISGIILIVALSYAYRANGVSLYCMAMQATSHLLSSLLLVLRFVGEYSLPSEGSEQGLLRRQRRKFLVREQILSEVMGIAMLLSAAGLLFKAFRKIRFWDKWYLDHRNMDEEAEWATAFLAWYGFAVYFIQVIFRFVAARRLRRSLVWHSFSASIVSCVFLFVLGFAASYEKEWSWKAEPIAAIILSFVSLAEGIRIIILHLDDMDDRVKWDPRA